MPSNIESFSNPRDSLPNVYTNIAAREVDFVTRFNKNWDALRTILGIMRPIRKAPGTKLVSYRASVALESVLCKGSASFRYILYRIVRTLQITKLV